MKVAVLITSFNRKQHTFKCIRRLFGISKRELDVYLLDDSSSDGTASLIAESFPSVNIINGSGNCFWNRGMYKAWQEGSKKDYDFYIWLNDDVVLYEDSLEELYRCSRAQDHRAVISGIIECKNSRKILYGGSDEYKRLIKPNGNMQNITFMNGNVVLVPKVVFNNIGNLDPVFHHDLGDVDFGLRAKKRGFNVLTTTKPVASGESNPQCRVRLQNSTLRKRFQKLYSPLGSNPFINFHFRKRHYGLVNASIYFLFQHFLNLLPDSLNKTVFGDRYVVK